LSVPADNLRVGFVWSEEEGRPVYTADADAFKCPACGQKKRKPRTEGTRDATPKERSRVRIDIPPDERATGYDDFMEMLGHAKARLGPELGYDEDTPNWYVLFAVLRDWLDSFNVVIGEGE
jgi:hypothetical protein